MLSNHLVSLNYNAAVLWFNDVLFFVTHDIGRSNLHLFRKIMSLEGKWSVDLDTIHVWGILLSCLLPRVVTLPSRMKGGSGWRVCTGWDVSTIWNDNVWEQRSWAAPAPARVSICASAWSTFCDGDTSLWTWTETPRATKQPQFSCCAPSDTCHLLCAWPCDVPAIRALCFIKVSRAVMSHFSARLISTRVSNSTRSRFLSC